MLALLLGALSPLLGILGSILPSIVKIFDRKQEIQYELQLTKLQGDIALATADKTFDIEQVKSLSAERTALYAYDSNLDGGVFINALKASVRPVITYTFFVLFIVVKMAAAYTMLASGTPVPQMLIAVWDPESMALFSTIVAFWFGSRTIEKMQNKSNLPSTNTTTTTKNK
jgi:hypothetical protein